MKPDRAIINRLLEIQEDDNREIEFYLTGLLQPFIRPYPPLQFPHGDLDKKKVVLAIDVDDVRILIKNILNEHRRTRQ